MMGIGKQQQEANLEVEKDPSGRYVRFSEVLGQGAFKTVYKAFDEIAGLEVAWNRLNIEDFLQQEPDKLYAEIHLLKSLKHDNIIKLYNFWVDEKHKTINMITELFTSGSLRQYRKKHRNVDMKAIKNWARQILRGLHYLHSHHPPIIHRDLKCENIFVNGNTGDVKIGDLGLAIVIEQATTRSVAGTPAFMAPELYDEDYNELVDVYSFGMCLLEMVTCEFPYRECLNSAQIYKKVICGVKPASLSRVSDPKVKEFIDKCLLPANSRLPAIKLLDDPFLACDSSKPLTCDHPLQQLPKLINIVSHSKGLDFKVSAGSCETPRSSSFEELKKFSANYEFRLRGKKVDDNQICFSLCVVEVSGSCKGRVKKIDFPFYLDLDTATLLAREMVVELKFSEDDVLVAAELIDSMITKIIPWQNALLRNSSRGANTNNGSVDISQQKSNGVSVKKPNDQFAASRVAADTLSSKQHVLSQQASVRVQDSIESIMTNLSVKHGITIGKDSVSSGCGTLDMMVCSKGLNGYSLGSDHSRERAKSREGNGGESVVMLKECPKNGEQVSAYSPNSSLRAPPAGNDPALDELKPELDYIDAQYNHCLNELLRMKEEAIENAKKRWMAQKSSSVSS